MKISIMCKSFFRLVLAGCCAVMMVTLYTPLAVASQSYTYAEQLANNILDQQMTLYAESRAVDILNEIITESISEEEKEKVIHDYIVKHAKYDDKNFINKTIPRESYHAYGVLVLGCGVCQGYAEATNLLCEKAGIPSKVIHGEALGEDGTWTGHAWNLIQLKEKWYHLDTTWDDPVPDQGNKVMYNYYNLTDDQIELDHRWDNTAYPIADTYYTKQFEMSVFDQLMMKLSLNPDDQSDTKKFYGYGIFLILLLLYLIIRK